MLTGAASDPAAVAQLVAELHRHVDAWLAWVRGVRLLDEAAAAAVAAREAAVRAALCQHEREAGERFMGAPVAAAAVRPATCDIDAMVAEVQRYVPGYKLNNAPIIDGNRITISVEVEGLGDFLPKYAGNLDIMTAAGLRTAEMIAQRRTA